MPQSWMLARLNRETETCHRIADRDRMAMLSAPPTVESYLGYLVRIYGFEAPVESAFAMTHGLDEWIDLQARMQSKLLRADLAALGVTEPTRLPRCTNVFPFRHVAAALGWMYAVDRNMLFHGIIAGHLRRRLPGELEIAGAYLAMQERSAGTRWRELGAALDRAARTPAIADHIVQSASLAFRCQHAWYQLALPRRLRVA